MKITYELLRKHDACRDQLKLFQELYPQGLYPSIETLTEAEAAELDAWWACVLLPPKGPGSYAAYALWCVQQAALLAHNPTIDECLRRMEKEVRKPSKDVKTAQEAFLDVTRNLYEDIPHNSALSLVADATTCAVAACIGSHHQAKNTAYFAARAIAKVYNSKEAYRAAGRTQLACLAQLLEEAP